METTTIASSGDMSKMTHHLMPLAEVFEQMSHGKVSGDNWMVDDCGNLKIMLHNNTVKNLDEHSECCEDLAVFDVKVMIATNCLQKKAWSRGIEYSKEKYSKHHHEEEEHLDMHPNTPTEIIINL
jgi:hypothetical protein